jgi:hypothetical protein
LTRNAPPSASATPPSQTIQFSTNSCSMRRASEMAEAAAGDSGGGAAVGGGSGNGGRVAMGGSDAVSGSGAASAGGGEGGAAAVSIARRRWSRPISRASNLPNRSPSAREDRRASEFRTNASTEMPMLARKPTPIQGSQISAGMPASQAVPAFARAI